MYGGAENLHQRIVGAHTRRRWTAGNAAAKDANKYDRIVKTGYTKQRESNGFPNYFIAQKVRAKVLNVDEEIGNSELINYDRTKKLTVPVSDTIRAIREDIVRQ